MDRSGSGVSLLLRPVEAAKALAISTRSLWSLTQVGEIKSVRLGRSVRYSVIELNAYIQRMETGNDRLIPKEYHGEHRH